MNPHPHLIIISGHPATGKTFFGKLLAEKYQWPLFFKDQFKEMMYDHFGKLPDREESRLMGIYSIKNLEIITEELISKDISHIIEANFHADLFTPYLKNLKEKFDFHLLQIQMVCDEKILLKRFKDRSKSAKIHPGHQGLRFLKDIKNQISQKIKVFEIDSETFFVDTSDLNKIDYTPVFHVIDNLT